MDNKAKQQIIDLLDGMPSWHILQMHKIKQASLNGQALDLLMFGSGHPPETFSANVAQSLIDVLDKPLYPVIFDEMCFFSCPEKKVLAMSQAYTKLQSEAVATYNSNMDDLADRFRPSLLGSDDPVRLLIELYAGGRCVDIRDIHAEGSDLKLATVALIADEDTSCVTWLNAAKAISKPLHTTPSQA